MLLKQIHFHNFRNFSSASFSLNPFLTIIIGENARGKTNLLEGIHVLLQGQGFRETKEEELIHLEKKLAFIEGIFGSDKEKFMYRISINKKQDAIEKHFYMDKTKKRYSQYIVEQVKAILFSPEQIEIITGSPGIRRDYFDKLIAFYIPEYKKRLDNYEHAIRRRNKVLEIYRDESRLKEELVFWNDYLEQQATFITQKRKEYVLFLNTHRKLDSKEFHIEYIANEFTKEKLTQVFDEEKRWRRTVIGPQKDDFHIIMKDGFKKNIHYYGSRSEQRMGIFWLKMNEIRYHENERNKKPILLLDDVFSELDSHNKKIIMDLIKKYQTVITTTEREIVDSAEMPHTIIRL